MKTLVIGLDGATDKILSPLKKSGKIPHLAKLFQTAHGATLESVIPPMTAPAWISMQTGVNPGKHGIYYFFDRRKNPGQHVLVDHAKVTVPKYWDILSQHYLKSLMLNVPMSYPPRPLNGLMTSSFMTPNDAVYTYPRDMQPQLESLGYRIDVQIEGKWGALPQTQITPSQADELLTDAIDVVTKRVDTFLTLVQENYDHYFIYFKATDFIQHLFFNQSEVDKFWHKLDRQLGRILGWWTSVADPKTIMVISDHGFHQTADIQFSPYVWLKQLLRPQSSSKKSTKKSHQHIPLKKILKQITTVSQFHKKRIANLEQQATQAFIQEFGLLPTPEGLYAVTEAASNYIPQILKQAPKITYRSKSIFKYLNTREDTYVGPYVNLAPDIVWITQPTITLNMSALTAQLFEPRPTHIQGDHTSDQDGIIYINSSKPITKKTKYQIVDIMPTILSAHQIPVPKDVDGTSIISSDLADISDINI